MRVWGQLPPHFGQDARDFLKIDKKIGVGKVKKQIFRKVEGLVKIFIYVPRPTFLAMAMPMGGARTIFGGVGLHSPIPL